MVSLPLALALLGLCGGGLWGLYAARELVRRRKVAELVAAISSRIVSLMPGELDEGLHTSLRQMAENFRFAAAAVYRCEQSPDDLRCTHVVVAHGKGACAAAPQLGDRLGAPVLAAGSGAAPLLIPPAADPSAGPARRPVRSGAAACLGIPFQSAGRLEGLLWLCDGRGRASRRPADLAALRTLTAVIMDALARRQADTERRALDQRQRDIINFLPDPTFVVDREGRVLAWNRALEELSGVSQESMLGQGDHAYALPFYGERRPLLVDLVLKPDADFEARYEKYERRGDRVSAEVSVPGLDGAAASRFWAVASPLYNAAGEVIGGIESVRDLRELEETQQRLRRSETRYRHLVDAMDEGLCIEDAAGRIVFANHRLGKLLRLPVEALMGRALADLFDGPGRAALSLAHDRAAEDWIFEAGLIDADAVRHPVLVSMTPYQDGELRGSAWLVTIADLGPLRKAEEAKKLLERQYQAVFEAINDAIFLYDARSHRLLDANRRACELVGATREEMRGTDLSAQQGRHALDLLRLLADRGWPVHGGPDSYEEQIVGRDGRARWVEISLRRLFLGDDDVVLAVARDITDRRLALNALRESERTLSTLMGNLPGMAYRCRYEPDRTLEFVSEGCLALTGYPATALLAAGAGRYSELIEPVDRERVWREVQAAVTLRQPFQCEYRLRTAGGERRWIWERGSGIVGADGEVAFLEGFAADDSERKHAEERLQSLMQDLEERVAQRTVELREAIKALQVSEERHRRLIENLREGYFFFSCDPDLTLTYVSPSVPYTLGHAASELLGPLRRHLSESPGNAAALDQLGLSLRGVRQPPFEMELRHRDGTRRIVEALVVPVFDESGKVVAVEGIAHDVTEARFNQEMLQRQQEQLAQAEKMAALGSLVAGVAHEINTPIGIGITAATHLGEQCRQLGDIYRDGRLSRTAFECFLETAAEAAQMIHANLARSADLVQSFKQIAVDQSSEERRRFDLRSYLEEILRSLGPELKRSPHAVTVDCPAGLLLHSYPGAYYQIVTNLIFNSLTHAFAAGQAGHITIAATAGEGRLRLLYADDGRGIAPAELKRIFEPFYTTRRSEGGTGLGLHIVYNLVTQTLGGSIRCESTPGEGVRFTIDIPLQEGASDESDG